VAETPRPALRPPAWPRKLRDNVPPAPHFFAVQDSHCPPRPPLWSGGRAPVRGATALHSLLLRDAAQPHPVGYQATLEAGTPLHPTLHYTTPPAPRCTPLHPAAPRCSLPALHPLRTRSAPALQIKEDFFILRSDNRRDALQRGAWSQTLSRRVHADYLARPPTAQPPKVGA